MPPTLKGDQRAKNRQIQISHCRVEKNDRIQKLKKNSDIPNPYPKIPPSYFLPTYRFERSRKMNLVIYLYQMT